MKLKELQSRLQIVEAFKKPKLHLEQYATRPHIAARVLHTIESCYNDIEDKIVADFGCGAGVLTIGVALLNCRLCVGFDIDSDALNLCQANVHNLEVTENINLIQDDLLNFANEEYCGRFYKFFDTVILNPPFGTKCNKGIDIQFLKGALNVSANSVYSLHKTSTRDYIGKKADEWNVKGEPLAVLKFDIPPSYKFHKRQSFDVEVDFWRFSHPS
ncbi:METTL5 (predicted) [Pycnogonum litorale]